MPKYKGIPAAVMDTIGGTVDFTFGDLGAAIAQVKGGKLNALAVTSLTRGPLTPGLAGGRGDLSGLRGHRLARDGRPRRYAERPG